MKSHFSQIILFINSKKISKMCLSFQIGMATFQKILLSEPLLEKSPQNIFIVISYSLLHISSTREIDFSNKLFLVARATNCRRLKSQSEYFINIFPKFNIIYSLEHSTLTAQIKEGLNF